MANKRIGANAYRFQQDVALDVASVAASTVTEETFSVPGLKRLAGPVVVNKITNDSGLVLVASRISADNVLALTFWNATGGAINAASQTFKVVQL